MDRIRWNCTWSELRSDQFTTKIQTIKKLQVLMFVARLSETIICFYVVFTPELDLEWGGRLLIFGNDTLYPLLSREYQLIKVLPGNRIPKTNLE